ncbi:MAG: hypothetical protein HOH20_16515 [Rhodospirillaceae bacterium]|jgi:hypothetical protein|nr:hypothetical protein [Rhodospirillaceae bacterium]MBT5567313.1 hypothetical protein [Rhodospirillaceae bacterium]MBT6091178.1 hypothetical protein [Rhodospirillaceae bacterium]
MPQNPPPSQPILNDGKFPDRRAPPSRLKDHGIQRSTAPSVAQRLLLASRVREALDEGLSKWDRSHSTKPPTSL